MKPAVELNELMERIRHAANRENGPTRVARGEVDSTSDLPPVPDPLFLPPVPPVTDTDAEGAGRPENLLDEAASMLLGGRKKNAVPAGVPKILRQFFRNQGGYNSVLLEAVERLVELNRLRRQQNYELHERLMALHTWTHSVAQASAENRDWMLVADARLRSLAEGGVSPLEERLARLEKLAAHDETLQDARADQAGSTPAHGPAAPIDLQRMETRLAEIKTRTEAMEAANVQLGDQLDLIRAQAREQGEYTRHVHGHLDNLGAHVEAGLDQLAGQVTALEEQLARLSEQLRHLPARNAAA